MKKIPAFYVAPSQTYGSNGEQLDDLPTNRETFQLLEKDQMHLHVINLVLGSFPGSNRLSASETTCKLRDSNRIRSSAALKRCVEEMAGFSQQLCPPWAVLLLLLLWTTGAPPAVRFTTQPTFCIPPLHFALSLLDHRIFFSDGSIKGLKNDHFTKPKVHLHKANWGRVSTKFWYRLIYYTVAIRFGPYRSNCVWKTAGKSVTIICSSYRCCITKWM